MQAIIMADGVVAESGEVTTLEASALLELGGRRVIDYALSFASAIGAEHRIVVSGFLHREVARHVAHVDVDAVVVENSDFRKGNLLSLLAGRARLEPGGFLLTSSGQIYPPAMVGAVSEVAHRAREVTAFRKGERTLLTWVPSGRVAAHADAAHHLLETAGEGCHVEQVLVELARRGEPPAVADISGHGWLEIDEPDERAKADEVLRRERWWQLENPQ
jgi:CTP:molybdopterin cytidylyltransferase MocA